ncbi:MAG: TolC family protein [Bacteroidia bacterium]
MKRKKIKIIALLFGFGTTVYAQQAADTTSHVFSLQQSVDYALQHQTSIIDAQYSEQAAEQKVKEIRGIGLPQITGDLDAKDFIQLPTQLIPAEFFGGPAGTFIGLKFGTKYNATGELDASQILFDGSYLVGLQAAKVYRELSQKATQRTKIEVAEAVTKAYYSVLVSQEQLKLISANLVRLETLQNETKTMHDNGFAEQIDLDRIMVTYNNTAVEREKIERLIQLSDALLKYQMGMTQDQQLTLTDSLGAVDFTPIAESSGKFNYSNRIEYSLLQTQLKAAQLELKKNRFDYLPSVALYGSVSEQAQRNEFDVFEPNKTWFATQLIGLKVGIPIFDGFQKHFRVQESAIGVLQAKNNLHALEQSIDFQLSNAEINLQNATASLGIQKKNISLAQNVDDVAKKKYEQGVGSNIEMITAETSLKEAQTNYYSALYDALIAKIEFEKSEGTLVKQK